jgi:S-adenosylmethionine:tRNA ribosyltransferase-isomerase
MEEILIEDYNYPLPDERIAKYPLPQRDQSKLLVYHNGQIEEDSFCHIGNHLSDGSLLIYNNTRVIQARLEFHKKGVQDFKGAGVTTALNSSPIAYEPSDSLNNEAPKGARIEVFCLEPMMPHDYQLALSSTESCTWKCMIGNAKKWKSGTLSLPVTLASGQEVTLLADKGEQTENTFEVHFSWDKEGISFAEILDAVGELPIPPYLNRKTEESDKTTYQTVYSRIKGSVAAPTAGLHFTNNVLDGLRQRGIHTAEVTLHVGAGTFQPVKTADANQHTMHTEIIAVPRDTITTLIDNLGHIVAVGTTSMRTLESLYFLGEQLHTTLPTPHTALSVAQFAPYMSEHTLSTGEALQAIVDYLDSTGEDVLHAETQIMIRPGYTFRIVDKLITNFHQPKSTLLLLVSAFVGGDWHTIYDYALAHNFRFLSYGDSSILTRSDYSRH